MKDTTFALLQDALDLLAKHADIIVNTGEHPDKINFIIDRLEIAITKAKLARLRAAFGNTNRLKCKHLKK